MPLVTLEETFSWMLIFGRVGGLLFFIPPFAGRVVPVQLRVGLAFLLAYILSSVVPVVDGVPVHFMGFMLSMIYEIILGVLLGFVVRIFFFIIEFAGQVISTEMGLMMSSSFNPSSNEHSSTVTHVLYYFGIILFFVVGAHKAVIQGLVRSFDWVPAGKAMMLSAGSSDLLVRASSEVFLLAVQIAAPVIGVNFLVNFTFSILGKVVPRMNVFMVSFSVRILAGFTILLAALGVITHYLMTQADREIELMVQVIAS
ncbi:MAG TPA: flagellar biosynthetic protein FliR [Opitutae bacterium]|nr:flagellar biosynthetic protein FliR [Opitutae bacterium]|tara:strand:- start:6964 stop:7731 length:768 start_codon:yes stop_codon:yes gene_type:complete